MAIADAIRSAVLRTNGTKILEVFSADDQVGNEMADLSNEVAADIAASHQWQALTKIAAITGTGQTAFDLPTDYDRMLTGSGLQDASSPFWGYDHILYPDEWVQRLNDGYTGALKGWIILGGQLQFNPAPSGTVNFPYISTYWARAEDGTPKDEFTADNDTFFLGDRLLTLGLIWRWKEMKGLEYAEDMQNYETALSQKQLRDGGPRILLQSYRFDRRNVRQTYINRAPLS